MSPKTLYDKIWDAHLVHQAEDGTCLLYIDRHLVHEVTSPQAFEGLRMTGRTVRAPDKTIAVPDHNVPTTLDRAKGIENEESRIQVEALDTNAKERQRRDQKEHETEPQTKFSEQRRRRIRQDFAENQIGQAFAAQFRGLNIIHHHDICPDRPRETEHAG